MRKRSLWEYICISGLPWVPILTAGGLLFVGSFKDLSGRYYVIDKDEIRYFLALSISPTLMIFMKNMLWTRTPKKIGLFTWMNKFDYEPQNVSDRKFSALHPPIDDEYLSRTPDGLVLGKKGKDFVRVKMDKHNILNTIIMGSTGTGKSVLLITYLLYQFHKAKNPATVFALDTKPELACKSVVINGNKKVHVMNPDDRVSYGWDVYYNLSVESTDDEIMVELDIIARALIDAGKGNERNEFFYQSARIIFKAIMFYTFKLGRTFMQGLNYLMDGSISDVVANTMSAINGKIEFRIVKRLLSPYVGKKGEAFEGIEMSFRESLDIFTKQSLQFFLDINPRKASPKDLEDKISIFFAIHENKLKEYKCLLRLITMQVMNHCSFRPENSHMITLIIDEAYRLGAINWVDFLSTSRSRQVATILAFQSLSQMQSVWGKDDARSLIELCRVIAVLSCADTETAQMLSSWCGEYMELNHSINQKGEATTSYSSKKILQHADIMTLQDQHEAVLFIKGKYFRTNVMGARYYNIKDLNIISEKCKRINEQEVSSS